MDEPSANRAKVQKTLESRSWGKAASCKEVSVDGCSIVNKGTIRVYLHTLRSKPPSSLMDVQKTSTVKGRESKWLLFILMFALSLLQFGLIFAFGALFNDILETFDTNRATAATVQSLLIGVTLCFCVVSGFLINKFGIHVLTFVSSVFVSLGFAASFFVTDIRYLFFTISVLAGVGISLTFVSSLTAITVIFTEKQKTLCLAIFTMNVPLASVFYPYLLQWLSKMYGLKGTFLILGGVFCNTFVLSMLTWMYRSYFTTNTGDGHREANDQSACIKVLEKVKIVMSKHYTCLLIATGISMSALNGFIEVAFDVAKSKGLAESEAKSTFVIFNCFSCIVIVLPGLLKQRLNVDLFFYLFVLSLLGVTGSTVLYLSRTYVMYVFGTIFMSAMTGIITSALIICADLISLEHIGIAIGLLQAVGGLLSIGTGPIFESRKSATESIFQDGRRNRQRERSIRDRTGSYGSVLIVIALVQSAVTLLFLAVFISRKNTKTSAEVLEENEVSSFSL